MLVYHVQEIVGHRKHGWVVSRRERGARHRGKSAASTIDADSYLAVGLHKRLSSQLSMLDLAGGTLRPKNTNKQW